MKTIDCKGLACPAPVLTTKNAIEKEDLKEITIMVDNDAAKQNVVRFMESQNFDVKIKEEGSNFHVIGTKKEGFSSEDSSCEILDETKKIMVMVANDKIGHGDDELGAKLMKSFLSTLKEMVNNLWRLVFVNNGVKLTIDDSEILPVLKELEEQGTYIMVCGTCLNHFNLQERKVVGETTNMLDIVTALQLADKVINL